MTRILSFADLHAPLTHAGFFNWLIEQIEEFKPHIIVNVGDWPEGKPAKRWEKYADEKWSALDEILEVSRQADAINKAAPDAVKHWIFGNHCANFFKDLPGRIPDDLQACVDWRNLRGTEPLEQWKILEEYTHESKLRIGPVTFQHGCELSKDGYRACKDMAYMFGTPYGLHVSGHSHKPLAVTRCEERSIKLPYWVCNPGTGADWDRMHYMDRLSKHRWGRGVVLIEVPDSSVKQSRSAYASKQWDAELRVHSLYSD